jgi:hypothetical protein
MALLVCCSKNLIAESEEIKGLLKKLGPEEKRWYTRKPEETKSERGVPLYA